MQNEAIVFGRVLGALRVFHGVTEAVLFVDSRAALLGH